MIKCDEKTDKRGSDEDACVMMLIQVMLVVIVIGSGDGEGGKYCRHSSGSGGGNSDEAGTW